ncbi:MAG TPA: glycosyltransferase family 39 protein, partial [Anaerolineae bacterium]
MTTQNTYPLSHDAATGEPDILRSPTVVTYPRMTVEMGLWFLMLAATFVTRVASLGQTPLSNLEAQSALDSLAIIRGDAITVANPLHIYLQSIAIALLGASEFSVRLTSVLTGLALCLLPLLAREQMGRKRALVFSAIMVLSPAVWFMSRVADGQLLAWTIAITTLMALLRKNNKLTAVGTGLLLACGRDAVSPLIIMAVAILVMLISRETVTLERPRFSDVLVGLVVFVAASTLFLWRPSGLGDAFNGVAGWPVAMRTAGDFSLLRVVAGFAIYEPLILLSAICSISILVVRQSLSRIDAIWVAFIIGGLVLVLVDQSRTVSSLLPIIIGFAALATHIWVMTIESAFEHKADFMMSAVVIGVSILMLVYAYLALRTYADQ